MTDFEYYTLDSILRRDQIIEGFQSFIWTERYSAYGDFQIVIQSTYPVRQLLLPGTRITRKNSDYVMTVDTAEDTTDDDGTRNITVTGKSLESLLDDRVAMPALATLTTTPNWVLTGTPGNIVRAMFNAICVNGALSQLDTIPFYTLGTLRPAGNLPEPSDIITVTVAPDTLYNTMKSICDTYSMGFRLVKNADLGQIYFEVFMGNDLTSDQSLFSPVIFDPNMDNLEKITLLTSTALVKTVAYVFASNGNAVVYAPDADSSSTGSDRRVLLVNSSNDGVAGPALTAALQQEGLQALTSQREVFTFDGELPQNVPFMYGTDFKLGDLVEERNSDGYGNQMIVTEQIFTSDDTGDRSFPTLVLSQTITPGSWASWDGNQEWAAVDPSINWADL